MDLRELLVVRASAARVDETTRNSGNEKRIVDLELNDMVELLLAPRQHFVQLLSLRNRPREAVKYKTMEEF